MRGNYAVTGLHAKCGMHLKGLQNTLLFKIFFFKEKNVFFFLFSKETDQKLQ